MSKISFCVKDSTSITIVADCLSIRLVNPPALYSEHRIIFTFSFGVPIVFPEYPIVFPLYPMLSYRSKEVFVSSALERYISFHVDPFEDSSMMNLPAYAVGVTFVPVV